MSIQDLLNWIYQTGLSDDEIGKQIGAPQSIVYRLRVGAHKSTSFERGIKIKNLYDRLKRKEVTHG